MVRTKGGSSGANDEWARDEYELSVNTQMHFNEILMKFRSVGVTAVAAIDSYAVTRPMTEIIKAIGLTPSQVIAVMGIVLTAFFALLDLGYFLPLLLGAVTRSQELERNVHYRLTSTISGVVSKCRTYWLISAFYLALAVSGGALTWLVLPHMAGESPAVISPIR